METYAVARRGFFDWFSHLITTPEPENPADPDASLVEALEHKLDGFNFASDQLLEATLPYYRHEDTSHRAAALDNLLYQMEAQLQVALFVWQIINAVDDETDTASINQRVLEAFRPHPLARAFRRLLLEIPPTFQESLALYTAAPQMSPPSQTLEDALDELRFEIAETLDIVQQRTKRVGLRLVRSILQGEGQPEAPTQQSAAIELLRGQQNLGNSGWGLEDAVPPTLSGLAAMVRQVIINGLERLVLLIESNELIRHTISDWLTELSTASPSARQALLETLLEQLFQTQHFQERQLPEWITDATHVGRIQTASHQIDQLGVNFERLSSQVMHLCRTLEDAELFQHPLLRSTGNALRDGLLGIIIFAGFDHIDEGNHTLNLARGIKEVLVRELPVSAQTILLADYR
ncbi:MAG: hypothetical protein HC915_12110 [Anaerolineae bacterium]|nr:hypothetical protein [Anaerolineae bacterium]